MSEAGPYPERSGPDPWPDADRGPWTLETVFLPVAGRWELCGLNLQPVDLSHPQPLTTTELRKLVPSRLAAEHRAGMRRALKALAKASTPPMSEQALAAFLAIGSAGDDGTYWSGQRLANVARAYSEAYVRGDPPTKAVAERLHISRSLAGKLVHRCRRKGLLTPVEKKG